MSGEFFTVNIFSSSGSLAVNSASNRAACTGREVLREGLLPDGRDYRLGERVFRASKARPGLSAPGHARFWVTSNERLSKSKYIEPSKLTRSSGKKVPVVVIDASQMWSEAQCQVGGKRFIRMNHTGARIFTAFSQAHAHKRFAANLECHLFRALQGLC